jgi:hypothetical protein
MLRSGYKGTNQARRGTRGMGGRAGHADTDGGMMHALGRWLLRSAPAAALGALVLSASGQVPGVAAAQSGPVSPHPATGTPALAPTGTTEQIRQLVACGGTMYAVGSFTRISQRGQTFTRNNVFSFSQAAPYTITSWTPSVNGTVNSIQLTSNCNHAFIGGKFTQVDGSSAGNIAYIRTYNNTMVQSWAHAANGQVDTILRTANGHLLVGGQFTAINGSSKRYYVSLNPGTGRDDGYLNLNVSGHYVYPGVGVNNTDVYNQQLSPDGGHVLVEGVFTRVQSNARQQIFMLNLGNHGNVSTWNSSEFSHFCADKHPFYIKSAAWSPDMSTVYIADTGFTPLGWNHTFPLTGLCDAVAAFPATRVGGLTHQWVNYTGCDSLYSVAADASAVYIGGHERWANNANGCNSAGPGAVPAPGLGGFTRGGALLKNSSGTAGLYSRDRGLGADQIYRTGAGIWIASDNQGGSNACGGVSGLAGICFLPYS